MHRSMCVPAGCSGEDDAGDSDDGGGDDELRKVRRVQGAQGAHESAEWCARGEASEARV